jgi:uncharacterized protein (TIGR02466 family)
MFYLLTFYLYDDMIKIKMKSVIHTWFPTPIYISENLIDQKYNEDLKKYCLDIFTDIENGAKNWNCNTFNTLGSFDPKNDKVFHKLIEAVTVNVKNFASMHGSTYEYECLDGWININHKNTYQEYHCHANSTFSAVYYIDTPEKSGRIVFENPNEPDMLPIKQIESPNELSYRTCHYLPEAGTLIIFRSYLRHMVEIGLNETPRITAAFNF